MRRLKSELADWHIFNVGSRRMALYRDDLDSNVFLSRVRKGGSLSGCIIWAYTLMTNHFHMVVRCSSSQLSRFMHHLQRLYSRYHNHRYKLRGHAFAGPYGAVRQTSPRMLVRTLAYVFTNPVTARLRETPESWPWTSYRSFMGVGDSRLWLNALPLLLEIDPDIDRARAKVANAVETAILKAERRPPSKEPSTTDIHAEHFQWMLEQAGERASLLGHWDPVLLALVWAKNLGIFRTAIAAVLGGPLTASRRMELQRFRAWLARHPELAQSLQTP